MSPPRNSMSRQIGERSGRPPGTPRAIIRALATRWLEDGTVVELERQKRIDARRRQAIARAALPGLSLVGHPRSYLLWLPLPEGVRADRVATDLLNDDIMVSTAEPFAAGSDIPHALRLALGSVPLDALGVALAKVAAAVQAAL
jgi:DNA-binding transcriptional MocR family regulator